jgi:hypothetical protein
MLFSLPVGDETSHPLARRQRAELKWVVIAPDGEVNRLVPLSRQGLHDAGLELIETDFSVL